MSDTDPVVCTTISGLPVTAEREAWAHLQLAYIGWREGDAQYRDALDAARRGWPAWRIAQAWQLSPALIERLGGPVARHYGSTS